MPPMPPPAGKFEQVRALLAQGRVDQALAAGQRLAHGSPRDADAQSLLALVLMTAGDVARAGFFAQRAVDLRPADARLRVNLGRLLVADRRHADALRELDEACRLAPDDAESRLVRAVVLAEMGRFAAAEAACRDGLAIDPHSRELRATLAGALLNTGAAGDAAGLLDALAAEGEPDAHVLSTRALAMNYVWGVPRERVLAAHRDAGRAAVIAGPPLAARAAGEPPSRLRVGFVSPDFRTHSVAFFVLPLLRHLERSRVEVFAYFTNRFDDAMTARCRGLADHWRDCGTLSDEALAARVAADGVHVLVELSGHTQGHSLGAMSRRPAPVLATYLGYPNTTGSPALDVRLVDSRTDPRGAEAFSTERLVRLDPCFLCFEPPADAPPPARHHAPHDARGITFGSFNALPKVSDELLALWARVVKAVPGSRLVLKSAHTGEASVRDRLARRWQAAGGDVGSLDVLPPAAGQREHLAAYGGLDVALDPFPYHGTTTTLEALWMGVPVITLAGEAHASRVGVSILAACGREDWIAESPDSYVALAAGLARDAAALARWRIDLRERVRASPLCDGPGFASRFEAALREAWRLVAGGTP